MRFSAAIATLGGPRPANRFSQRKSSVKPKFRLGGTQHLQGENRKMAIHRRQMVGPVPGEGHFKTCSGTMALGIVLLLVAGPMAHAQGGSGKYDTGPLRYQVDPFWPNPLPNNWIMGQVGGLAIARQHLGVSAPALARHVGNRCGTAAAALAMLRSGALGYRVQPSRRCRKCLGWAGLHSRLAEFRAWHSGR